MRRTLTVILTLTLIFGAYQLFAEGKTPGQLVAEAKSQILHVSVPVAKDLFDTGDYVFVDVREPNETKMGFIPNAFLIPRGLLEFRIGSSVEDKSAKVVVYCKSGGRSALAALALKTLGYTNVISMDGGFSGWDEAGYPVDE